MNKYGFIVSKAEHVKFGNLKIYINKKQMYKKNYCFKFLKNEGKEDFVKDLKK